MKQDNQAKPVGTIAAVVRYNIGDNEIVLTPEIVQKYIVGTDAQITNQEFKMFTELCKVRKLNPFLKEAYLIKYNSSQPAQLVVGKDAIMKRAVLNPNYDGMESGVIVIDSEENVIERKGTFFKKNEILAGAWARAFRKDWSHPIYCSVNFDEVKGKKNDGSLNSNWASKGATMVEKVAKVRALREAFVEDLAGMYEAEEFEEEPIDNTNHTIIEQKEEVESTEPVREEQISIDEL